VTIQRRHHTVTWLYSDVTAVTWL